MTRLLPLTAWWLLLAGFSLPVAAETATETPAVDLTGHAVDLGAFVGGEFRWDWPLYHKIAAAVKQAAKEVAVPIEWGGDWKSFKDGPHYQLPWKDYP